jgi:RimJ/RimL family protein N-acetyltransferase
LDNRILSITYRSIDFGLDADCALLAKWENDHNIRHLSTWHRDETSFNTPSRPEKFKARSHKPKPYRRDLMILANATPIGEMSFELYEEPEGSGVFSVAWFSIVIGEAHARSKGIGKVAMMHLETLAHEAGATRAELGVFEFNEPALALYRKLGYREFKRIPEFTFWNGKMWTDIRMTKDL